MFFFYDYAPLQPFLPDDSDRQQQAVYENQWDGFYGTSSQSSADDTEVTPSQDQLAFNPAVSEVSEKVYQGSRNGTYMTVSKVTLMTSASDDGAVIKCRASHPALVAASRSGRL